MAHQGFYDLVEMQLVYVHLSFRELIEELKVSLELHFDEKIEIKQGIYTGFNILLVAIYIFLWRPFVMKLNREI